MTTLKHYLELLLSKAHLNEEEAIATMDALLDDTEPHQAAALLILLKHRGETAEEVVGMVKALEKRSIQVAFNKPVLDIVGTGGDRSNTVNISTGSAILTAACGIPVAKHGNRSVSSRCGSADLLEALGVIAELPSSRLQETLDLFNIVFMYAPYYHPDLKKVTSIRKALGIPTLFNLLGPLLNPAKAEYALIGTANEGTLELMAQVFLKMSRHKRVLVYHGNGLDELSTVGPTHACLIENGEVSRMTIHPEQYGFDTCQLADLQGGNAETNARLILEALSGKQGAIADALILNAGTALWIYGHSSTIEEGIAYAHDVLKRQGAIELLNKWRAQ